MSKRRQQTQPTIEPASGTAGTSGGAAPLRSNRPKDAAARERAASLTAARRELERLKGLKDTDAIKEAVRAMKDVRAPVAPLPKEPPAEQPSATVAATAGVQSPQPVEGPVRHPSWPPEEKIQRAIEPAMQVWSTVAILVHGTKLERAVGGTVPVMKMVDGKVVQAGERPKAEALAELSAPLLAKYFDAESAPMELVCGGGILVLLAAPFIQEAIAKKLSPSGPPDLKAVG